MKDKTIVLFDAYGTLFKIDTENKALDKVLGKSKNDFLQLWRTKLLEYSWLTSLMGHWEGFNTIIEKALKYASKIYKIDIDKISPVLMNIYEHPSLYNDSRKALSLLSEKECKCCIISNGEIETLELAVKENKISEQISMIFSASQVETYKVSPKVYRMPTSLFNIGPSKMFFVSSNSWDISGAKQFGFQTIWVNRDGKVFDTLVDAPDFEVDSLEKVADIIN